MSVGSHHNDVIVGKPCSIRFSAVRVVLVNGLNQQRRSPGPRLLVPRYSVQNEVRVSFWPRSAMDYQHKLPRLSSDWPAVSQPFTVVPTCLAISVDRLTHRSTRSYVAVGPECHSPIAIDRGLWQPGPWLFCTFWSVLGTLAPTGKPNDLRFARPVCPARQNPVLEALASLSRLTTPLSTFAD